MLLSLFYTNKFTVETALQLVVKGSVWEGFRTFRDKLNNDMSLVERYNKLKVSYAGKCENEYRIAKSDFIRSVIGNIMSPNSFFKRMFFQSERILFGQLKTRKAQRAYWYGLFGQLIEDGGLELVSVSKDDLWDELFRDEKKD